MNLDDGFVFGVNLGVLVRLDLFSLVGGSDLFLMHSDLRILTMVSSYSMGGVMYRGGSGGGGENDTSVDCTFCFFLLFLFFALDDMLVFLLRVHFGVDGGGRKCCVIFVF